MAMAFAGSALAAPPPISRTGKETAVIAESVTVPPGYDTVYFSGTGAADPKLPPEENTTEAQAMRTLDKIKAMLTARGMSMGDIVMMHAYVAIDPATGKGDTVGWNNAFKKFFGTPEQPGKPSRTTISTTLGGAAAKIEVEVIGVTPHKSPAGRRHSHK
jgi:enamine deaminase RidA (YjgF/YER057c/UK114 family)